MATRRNSLPGRPKKTGELADVRKEVLFQPTEWEKFSQSLKKGQKAGTILHDLGMQWSQGALVSIEDLEAYRMSVISQAGVDDIAVPHLGTVVCGPLRSAISEASEYNQSRETAEFLKIKDGDVSFDCEGQSMEGAGIPEGTRAYLRPYGEFGRPSKGDIILVEVSREDEEPSYTLKRFVKSTPFQVEDGKGNLVELPEDANVKAVAELVAYMVSV